MPRLLRNNSPRPSIPIAFGNGDLHMVNVLAIPDRLEDAIGKAENQQVLHRLFAEIMVDAVDLRLGEGAGDLVIERDAEGRS